MRALDISSDNVAYLTLLDHGQDLGKIATKDALNNAKQCDIFSVAENTVKILNQESSGGVRGVPLQFDEGKGPQDITQRTVDDCEAGFVLHRCLIQMINLVWRIRSPN
jgi:hypothetical protein